MSAVWRRKTGSPDGRRLRPAPLLGLGAVVGFCSALTGTGGPVLLVPILLFAGSTPLLAVGAGQAVQLPMAVAASAGYVLHGNVDFGLGTVLGIVGLAGVLAGARVAHAVPAERLRPFIGVLLVVCGAGILAGACW